MFPVAPLHSNPANPYYLHTPHVSSYTTPVAPVTPQPALDMVTRHTLTLVDTFLRNFIRAMGEGWVTELFDLWLTDDVEWYTRGLPVIIASKGKNDAITSYNKVVESVWGGPQSTVTFHIDELISTGQTCARCECTVSCMEPGSMYPRLMHRAWELAVRANKISSVVVTKSDPYHTSIAACPAAYILPPSDEAKGEGDRTPTLPPSDEEIPLPPLPPPSTTCPCAHNDWDSVRVKRRWVLLRCRRCAGQWRVRAGQVARCALFTSDRCPRGSACPELHVHQRKQTRAERQAVLRMELEMSRDSQGASQASQSVSSDEEKCTDRQHEEDRCSNSSGSCHSRRSASAPSPKTRR